jgi:hypothetical protein
MAPAFTFMERDKQSLTYDTARPTLMLLGRTDMKAVTVNPIINARTVSVFWFY